MKIFKKKAFWIPVIILLAFFLLSCGYTVKKNENAIVVHLGKIKTVVTTPGFHVHLPFVESVTKVYTGDILYDIPTSDVITSDKKSMIADDYVVWKVTNPSKYYQSLGAVRGRAEERIEAAVYNATKLTISSMKQDEIIAARGSTLTDMITKKSNSEMAQYGIEIEIGAVAVGEIVGPVGHASASMGDGISEEADGPSFCREGPFLGKAPFSDGPSVFIFAPDPPVPGAEAGRFIIIVGIREISASDVVHGMGCTVHVFRVLREHFYFIGGNTGISHVGIDGIEQGAASSSTHVSPGERRISGNDAG